MAVVLVETKHDDGSRHIQSPMKFKASAKASLIYNGIWCFMQNASLDIPSSHDVSICNWNRSHDNSLVYEDDLQRNYQLLVEIIIALRDTLTMDGLPHVKDLQGAYLLATLMHNWHRPLYTQRGGKGIIKDWASQQATQTRSLLGHLHYLARKAATSRNQKGQVLKTLYLRLIGKQVAILPEAIGNETEEMHQPLVVDVDDEPNLLEDGALICIKDEDDDEIATKVADGSAAPLAHDSKACDEPAAESQVAVEDSSAINGSKDASTAATCGTPDSSAEPLDGKVETNGASDMNEYTPFPESQPRQFECETPGPAEYTMDTMQTLPWNSDDAPLESKKLDSEALPPCPEESEALLDASQDEVPDLAQRQADLRGKKRDAENAKKADKLNAKRHRMEEHCGDGNGGPLKRPAAKKAAPKAGAKDKVETPKAKAKGLPKAIASPKKRSRKPKAADSVPVASPKVKATKRQYRRKAVPEASVESEAGQSTVEMTDKEKRRMNAQLGWKRLRTDADELPDLPCPASLGDKLSFTVKDPCGQGSSVGVILNTESFYINKAVKPALWPTTCKHIKVDRKQGVTLPWGPSSGEAWKHAKTVAGWGVM